MTPCWCCGGAGAPSSRLAPLPFLACARCGFAFRDDRADAEVHAVYEEGDYEEVRGDAYLRSVADRRRDARVRLAFLRPYAREGRLLDVGAAGGAFVAEAARAGFAAEGIEPTPAFAALAREQLGVAVRTGTVQSVALEQGAYDVCTLWHVLEHIPRPLGDLERLRTALKPAGVLALEVPNAGGILAHRQGTSWRSLEPEVHIGQYTPDAVRALLDAAGFVVLHVGTVTISEYLTPAARIRPRQLVHRVRTSAWLRSPRVRHPWGHELLRAVAVAPTSAATTSAA